MEGRRRRGRLLTRLVEAAFLIAVGTAQTGCSLLLRQYVTLSWDYQLENPADKRSDRDRFVEWRGKKKPGFQGSPFGILVAPIYLRAPFTLDQPVGIFDPDELAASANASGCVELDEEDYFGDLGHFIYMCLDYLLSPSPGVRVRTSVDANTMFYPSLYGGVIRFQADLTTLTLQFRPLGAVSFDTITTTPIADPTLQWFPSIGALGLYKGGVMDFDTTQWTNTPPANPSPVDQVGWGFEESIRALKDAYIDLDGFEPDLPAASTKIQMSFTYIGTTRSQLGLLPDDALARKVGTKLDCLDKNAAKALAEIGDGDVESAIGKIGRGVRCGGEGLVRLRGFRVEF